jgi:uncharacterized protein YodC (DUF2158 family)
MAISSEPLEVRAGDVVRLKSGGPWMTAERVDYRPEHPYAHCLWMDSRKMIRSAFIKLDALEIAGLEEEKAARR